MLTFIAMLIAKVTAPFASLFVVLLSWVLLFALFIISKPNRGKKQFKAAAIAGLIATVIADLVWFFKFFDNFQYINPGLGAVAWFLLLPVLMLLAVFGLSYVNSSRYIYDEKKRKEAEAKEKKAAKRKKQLEKELKAQQEQAALADLENKKEP